MALIKCPECGKQVSDKAVRCMECGMPIQEYINEKSIYATQNKEDISFINECDKDAIQDNKTEYLNENKDSENVVSSENNPSSTNKKKNLLIAATIIGIILIISAIVVLFDNKKTKNNSSNDVEDYLFVTDNSVQNGSMTNDLLDGFYSATNKNPSPTPTNMPTPTTYIYYTPETSKITWDVSDDMKTLYIRGKGIVSIETTDYCWGKYADYIEKVVIGEGITEVYGNYDISKMNFTDGSLTASMVTKNVKEVILPKSLSIIGEYAFANSKIETIDLVEGILCINERAFKSTKISKIKFPDSLLAIGANAFDGTYLNEVEFGEGLLDIGECAFSSCVLEKVYLPEKVTYLGKNVFNERTNVLYLPNSIEKIGKQDWAKNVGTDIFYGGSLKQWVGMGQNDSDRVHCNATLNDAISYIREESLEYLLTQPTVEEILFVESEYSTDVVTTLEFKDAAKTKGIVTFAKFGSRYCFCKIEDDIYNRYQMYSYAINPNKTNDYYNQFSIDKYYGRRKLHINNGNSTTYYEIKQNEISDTDNENELSNGDDYIFDYSSDEYLSREEIEFLGSKELIRIARNEIYARHGRIFKDEALNKYFRGKRWYTGIYEGFEFDELVKLNEYEKYNINLLKTVEDEY